MALIRELVGRLLPDEPSDRHQFAVVLVWLLAAGGVIGVAALVAAIAKGWIGGTGFLIGLLLLPVLLFAIARIVFMGVSGASEAFGQVVLAGGNLTPAASFSAEEAMVMQGRVAEARQALESRLEDDPDDVAVRLHLAALVRDQQGDHATAECLYLEGRSRPGAGSRADTYANLLIDLYQKTGNQGRLMAELARFADRNRGAPAGQAARRRLDELRAEIRAGSS